MPLHQTVSGSYRRQFACALYSTLASMLNHKHLIYSEMHFILHVFKIKWDWVRFVCRDFLLCCFFFSLVFTRWLEIYVCIDMSTRFVYWVPCVSGVQYLHYLRFPSRTCCTDESFSTRSYVASIRNSFNEIVFFSVLLLHSSHQHTLICPKQMRTSVGFAFCSRAV